MKVITFSTVFPATHPRKGVKTFFPEQILLSLGIGINNVQAFKPYMNDFAMLDDKKKFHTIRTGNRWKVGDWFSPRIWTGKPYWSKQLQFAPPIQIKKIWDFDMDLNGVYSINHKYWMEDEEIELLAKNDGLSADDMMYWLLPSYNKPKEFHGQILCWDESVVYQ